MSRRNAVDGRRRAARAGLLALVVGPLALSALGQPPPVGAYAELPPIQQVDLSSDGTRAVMLRAVGDTYQVVVADLDAGTMQLLMAADPEQFLFNWCRWANDERIVCSIRSYETLRAEQLGGYRFRRYLDGRTVFTRLLAVNADGSNQLQLVPRAITRAGEELKWNPPDQDTVVSWLDDDPRHILLQLRRERRDAPTLYRLDIYNNRMSRVRRAHPSVQRWYADRGGNLRLGVGYRDGEPVAFAVRDGDLVERDLSVLGGVAPPRLAGLVPGGSDVYVFANNGRDTRGLYRVDLRSGDVVETLLADPDFDVDGRLLLARGSGRALALNYWRERPALHWFDPALARRFEALRAAIPGHPTRLEILSVDDAVDRIVFSAADRVTPARHYLFDRKAGRLVRLASAYPDIERVYEARLVSYRARDGLDIPAYLTLPGGDPPYPSVVLPHGGPWSRDSGTFDYWTQFLASRGYAVLQPNFRGSSGYGDRFLSAGFEQWGLAMQDDLVDGLDWLVARGIADADRVCFVGGSYGGYAALVAAFKTPQRIRCAVSFAGVTDLQDLTDRWRLFDLGSLSIARVQEGGARQESSPLQQADRIGVPVLIVHGDVDRSVMIDQSRALVEALEAAGKPFRYVEQANGDHYLSIQSQRVEFLDALQAFLAEHLASTSG